jgi:hypothetical protein
MKGGVGDFSPKLVNSKITAINILLSTNERLAIKPARVRNGTRKTKLFEGLPGGGGFSSQALWKFVLKNLYYFAIHVLPCDRTAS